LVFFNEILVGIKKINHGNQAEIFVGFEPTTPKINNTTDQIEPQSSSKTPRKKSKTK
jgi:hypothetical protein